METVQVPSHLPRREPIPAHCLSATHTFQHFEIRNDDRKHSSAITMSGSQAASDCGSEASDQSPLWDVQEILAERSSATGANEVLVVWKTCWIPLANVQAGYVKEAWEQTRKWTASSMTMQVMLAVEPNSQLEKDIKYIETARADMFAAQQERALSAKHRHPAPQGPRKQLGK